MTILLMTVAFVVGMMAGALIIYRIEHDQIKKKLDQMLNNDHVFVDYELCEAGSDDVGDLVDFLKTKYLSDDETTNGEPDSLYV